VLVRIGIAKAGLSKKAFDCVAGLLADRTGGVHGDALQSRDSLWSDSFEDADGRVRAFAAVEVAGEALEPGNGGSGVGPEDPKEVGCHSREACKHPGYINLKRVAKAISLLRQAEKIKTGSSRPGKQDDSPANCTEPQSTESLTPGAKPKRVADPL
jgi:hypothetical protein